MVDKLPPRAEDGVFAVSSSSVIDAPIEKVWEILLDFPSYPEWNAFVRKQVVTDSSSVPLSSQTISEGSLLHLTVHLPPTLEPKKSPTTTSLVVTFLDSENHRVAWENRSLPAWFLRSGRWQWLTVLEDGKTKYETIEVFNGPAAWLVKWFVGGNLRSAFKVMADGLKERAENLVRSS